MKSKFFSRSGPGVKGLMGSIISLMLLAVFVLPNMAQASTMAGTSVTNTVTANYKSTGGTPFTATGSVTVTVSLQKAAPIVAFVSQSPVATVGSPTDEVTLVTQTYGIYAQANGPVQYTVNTPTYTPTTIGAATVGTLPSAFYLGATTVAYQATAGTTFYVPNDGTVDGKIGGTNGIDITTNNKVWINGAAYTVTGINENTAGDAGLPTDLQGKLTKVTLSTPFTGTLNPGDIVGQYTTFTVPVTTGALAPADTAGSYAGSLTVTDLTNTSAPALSSIYVARASLTVLKEVSTDGLTYGGNTSMTPGREVWYRITVTNNSTSKTVNTVSLTDVLSPYTAWKLASFTFTPGTSGLTYPTSTTVTYLDQTNAVYTPVSGGGGAPAGYDEKVSGWTIAFTGQTMSASGSFTLVYHVWLY